jgi:hypothetical protein
MADTKPDSRQIKKRQALPKLGTPIDSTVEVILDKINIEVDSPLRLAASTTPDALINFTATLITAADNAKKVVSPVKKQIFSALAASTINFQTQAVSNAAYFDISWPTPNTVGRFRYAAFTLIGSGKIKVLFSAEATSEALLSNPGALFVSGGLPIGYVALECTNTLGYFKTAASATNIIENAKIYRLAAGGGSSSSSSGGSGGGGELVDLLYNIDYRDSFVNIPDGTTTVDIGAGFTDSSLHDVANELFRISYDASKTITAVGTAVTISGAPTFTVKIGDIINVPGTDAPKKITAVASQTSVTVESAWTVDPSAAACNISQAVHTQDLNAFTAGGAGLAASSQYSGNIDEIMVGYEDTITAGDIIPDFGTAPVIAFSASSDSTSWTTAAQRVTSLSQQELASVLPTSSTQLRLRFFSNATSGSGSVNLLAYKVFFHKVTGSQIGSSLLTAFARPTSGITQNVTHSVVGGKSRFEFTFGYPRGLNAGEASGSALEVYANGQRIPRFVSAVTPTTEAYFTEDSGSVITMDTDYSAAGIDFQFIVKTPVIDSNTGNTTQISNYGDILDQQLDAQVIPTYITAINSAPSATQFRSDIVNRASIINLSSALAVQMGSQRMAIQEIYQISTESGLIGQPVFGAVNDKFNQIRFVGSGWVNFSDSQGPSPITNVTNDYIEVVFYGTGLNLLVKPRTATNNISISVDGGSSSTLDLGNKSIILQGRNYCPNQIFTIASGLSLGIHTVKLIYTSALDFQVYGFDVITETTSLRVTPGTAVKGRYKNVNSALQTVAYNSGFESGTLGTRGGRVLVYAKTDGTIGKALTPTNSAAAYLASVDHTNEEIIRIQSWREFGAGRADDFSLSPANGSTLAFTQDDNTHTLTTTGYNLNASAEALQPNGTNLFTTYTFVGTGLDIIRVDQASGIDPHVLTVDGVNQGSFTAIGTANLPKVEKLCSGLPYGTHTVRIHKTANAVGSIGIKQFMVYGPKKPSLPVGAIELGEYNLTADYIQNSLALTHASTGVIRKQSVRDNIYVGTWNALSLDTSFSDFFNVSTSTAASYVEYNFFGTGADIKTYFSGTFNRTISVDGSTNLTAYTINLVTSGTIGNTTLVAATGVLSASTAVGNNYGDIISIRNMPLGYHKIRMTYNSGNTMFVDALDVITPIHIASSNLPTDQQNTLSVGNVSIGDLRKFNKRDSQAANRLNYSQTFGVAASPTTTSTSPVPMPDMSVTHKSETGSIRISYSVTTSNNTLNAETFLRIYVNGAAVGKQKRAGAHVANGLNSASDTIRLNVPIGVNKIDVYWSVGVGTSLAAQQERNLLVEDV